MSTPAVVRGSAAANAWEALFRAQVALMRGFAAEDMWTDVSMKEYDVLFTLARAPEKGLRLKDLNLDVLMSQPSLSRMVERLEQRGLVERRPVPGDLRGTWVSLTPEGARVQKTVGRHHVESIEAAVGGALDADELQTLERLCRKLRAHAAPSPEPTTQDQEGRA